ncbi:MAG: Hpt domain-containing protein [Planctomycetota bacterium]|nr:Hpt domain-containing protein [Planctomycetota bacterium]
MRLFVEDLEQSTGAMREALAARDLEQLSLLAHRLRGAAGSYRFPEITRQAALVEAAVHAGAASDAVSCELASLEAICAIAHSPPESGARSDVE